MKRLCFIFITLVCAITFSACSTSNADKEKLIGTWHSWDRLEDTISWWDEHGGYAHEGDYHFYFLKNNEFYHEYVFTGYRFIYTSDSNQPTVAPVDQNDCILHGTYKLKDGIVYLTYDKDSEEHVPIEKRDYAYYISDYTKELLFDVDTEGKSEWSHYDSIDEEELKEKYNNYLNTINEKNGIND